MRRMKQGETVTAVFPAVLSCSSQCALPSACLAGFSRQGFWDHQHCSSLTVGCSCFTELGSGLLVGGSGWHQEPPVWLVVRGTHVMKTIWNHYRSAKSDNNCQLSLCFDLKKTPNILDIKLLDIKLLWRNRLRFEHIKL